MTALHVIAPLMFQCLIWEPPIKGLSRPPPVHQEQEPAEQFMALCDHGDVVSCCPANASHTPVQVYENPRHRRAGSIFYPMVTF